MSTVPPTRAQAIAAAGRKLREAFDELDTADPRTAALAAYVPGGPPVDELEDRIRARRGLPPLHSSAA